MREAGFLEQKKASPLGFTLVVLGHAMVLGAVVLIKGPDIIKQSFDPTKIFDVPSPQPDPPPPEKQEVRELPQAPTQIDQIPPVIQRIPTPGPLINVEPIRPIPEPLPPGPIIVPKADPPPVRDPVRVEARFDDRFADALQPPYPPAEQRAQREGQVRLRVTIGTDGRVKAVEKLSATSDAFWSMAERHARNRWRFKPATLDGRPVESQKIMTLHFRLENA
jgi:periplasmic protein TonB